MPVTRARVEPSFAQRAKRSMALGSPSVTISTRPSGRFLAYPLSPSMSAWLLAASRKKTPWTLPLTMNRRRTVAIACTCRPLLVRRERLQHIGELPMRVLPSGRDVLGRHLGGAMALQDLPGDGDLVHLVRAVVDAGGTGVAVHRLQREVARVAEGAV